MSRDLFLMLVVTSMLVSACMAPPLAPAVQSPAAAHETPAPAREMSAPSPAATPTLIAQAAPSDTAPSDTHAITVEALKNATYSGVYDDPITLTNGLFEQVLEGQRFTVEYVDKEELYGDLDGDGVDDAVVFLLERGGGSGAFTYVAAQLNRAGQPVDAGAVRIEDRIGVRSAAIEDGQVVMEIITQGPGDVACCGLHKAHKTYAVQEGRLVETTPEGRELVKVSAADLIGTSWTLLELNDGQPALADVEATINFQDGQFSGFGGCNNYTSSFNLSDDNPFVMTTGPGVATRKACPDLIQGQETAYFTALEKVSRWGYVFGRLALYYAEGQDGESRLLFAPQ